jgi:hypothetical protein
MIITGLLSVIYVFILGITYPLRILSDVSLPSEITSAITTASGYYHSLDVILPMDTMIQILGVSLTFEGLYLIYKLIMWVIKKIPGIN